MYKPPMFLRRQLYLWIMSDAFLDQEIQYQEQASTQRTHACSD